MLSPSNDCFAVSIRRAPTEQMRLLVDGRPWACSGIVSRRAGSSRVMAGVAIVATS